MINKELKISKSIEIDASKERVWEVLTNPNLIAKYLYGTETITDWKVGSSIVFQGEYNSTKYKDKGNVLVNKPFEMLKYNYWSGFSGTKDKPGNYSDITLSINEIDKNKVEFTWSQEGFSNEEGLNHSQEGLPEMLKQMKEIAENSN